jgi:hypothetical protein
VRVCAHPPNNIWRGPAPGAKPGTAPQRTQSDSMPPQIELHDPTRVLADRPKT